MYVYIYTIVGDTSNTLHAELIEHYLIGLVRGTPQKMGVSQGFRLNQVRDHPYLDVSTSSTNSGTIRILDTMRPPSLFHPFFSKLILYTTNKKSSHGTLQSP